ncbi:MAG: hypothetical protein ACK4HW_13220, partial [Roseinatronobacter sp.]
LNSDPLVSSVPRIITPAIIVRWVNHVPEPLSRQDYFSGLLEEEEFEGAGISFAATELEARHLADGAAVVIGGGNSAGKAAMFLCRRAGHMHLGGPCTEYRLASRAGRA